MDVASVLKAYQRYAPTYDLCFGPVLRHGRRTVVREMSCRPGESVLEVGVGTGLSLPLYPKTVQVTGIDLSANMLRKAADMVRKHALENVRLAEMDAEKMTFGDGIFDKAVAMYVVSVTPDPRRLMEEMRRVCRKGGDIYIVNHFSHPSAVLGGLERLLAPLSRVLGFDPSFSLQRFINDTGIEIAGRLPVNFFGYWTMLHVKNGPVPEAAPVIAIFSRQDDAVQADVRG